MLISIFEYIVFSMCCFVHNKSHHFREYNNSEMLKLVMRLKWYLLKGK